MPVVPTTAYSQAEDALNLTRSLANDAAGVVFTDAVLMPFLNAAYRTLQRELAENGVSVLLGQVDIDLPLTNGLTPTVLSDSSSPQLPADCLAPHSLWEMVTGSTNIFLPMEKIVGGLPNFQPGSYLRMWEWIEDQINLIGATQAITVRIRYEKVLPTLVYGTDVVQIRSSTDPLAYSTAAMAARSRGQRALAVDMASAAADATLKLIERYVRPEQFKVRRILRASNHLQGVRPGRRVYRRWSRRRSRRFGIGIIRACSICVILGVLSAVQVSIWIARRQQAAKRDRRAGSGQPPSQPNESALWIGARFIGWSRGRRCKESRVR
jgi:hypothetical protein